MRWSPLTIAFFGKVNACCLLLVLHSKCNCLQQLFLCHPKPFRKGCCLGRQLKNAPEINRERLVSLIPDTNTRQAQKRQIVMKTTIKDLSINLNLQLGRVPRQEVKCNDSKTCSSFPYWSKRKHLSVRPKHEIAFFGKIFMKRSFLWRPTHPICKAGRQAGRELLLLLLLLLILRHE